MPERLSRYLRLSAGERRLLHEALGILCRVWWRSRRRDLDELLADERPSTTHFSAPPAGQGGDAVAEISHALRRAANVLGGRANCLPQALAARHMLRTRGVHGVLYVGVCKDSSGLRSHAWVQAQGQAVVGGADNAAFRVVAERAF